MSGTRNYSIFVSCQINPSEDPSKIKTAVFNVFPDLKVSVNDQQLIGKSNHINSLSKISESIKSKKTAKTYERILKKNISTNSTWFYLNKQAAFVDTIAICDEADESSLGPIKVVLEANDIEITIKLITS
tara:strand:- start:162 stop:551 length:390 start_codon:yes stop_codon:yes gene_type:complete